MAQSLDVLSSLLEKRRTSQTFILLFAGFAPSRL